MRYLQATKERTLRLFEASEALARGPDWDARNAAAAKIQVRVTEFWISLKINMESAVFISL